MPESIVNRFSNVDELLLSHFPKQPKARSHWSTEYWHEAPFDNKFKKYLEFALSAYVTSYNEQINDQFTNIRKALTDKRVFYSFFKYDHRDKPGDIDFFVIDLNNKLLYIINHNT